MLLARDERFEGVGVRDGVVEPPLRPGLLDDPYEGVAAVGDLLGHVVGELAVAEQGAGLRDVRVDRRDHLPRELQRARPPVGKCLVPGQEPSVVVGGPLGQRRPLVVEACQGVRGRRGPVRTRGRVREGEGQREQQEPAARAFQSHGQSSPGHVE